MSPKRVAVVLFNLGGPDSPSAVRPFLENLFKDPAIISAPWFVRRPLAAFIARTRRKSATANYALMGGGSPILPQTQDQARALGAAVSARLPGSEVRTFIGMRYWKPFTEDAAREVAEFEPDEVVLTPLYPQFSTTTTGSSVLAWRKAYRGSGRVSGLCCWHLNSGFIDSFTRSITRTWLEAGSPRVRLLFSAHGLPQKVVDGGDPYQQQVEAVCAAVAQRLGAGWDWQVCYQSRVGPLQWLGPATPEAIKDAARDGVGVLIAPIAFVSEHVETLVELDREYAELAHGLGVKTYLRAATPGSDQGFIDGLADAVVGAMTRPGLTPDGPACSAAFGRCGRAPTLEPIR